MKPTLTDVVEYICLTYPHKSELSNARLTKMVYLADWRSASAGRGQMTDIRWVFNTYGPWVPDVFEAVVADPNLEVAPTHNAYGSDKRLIRVRPDAGLSSELLLDPESRAIVDSVIADTQSLYFGEFIDYVYDTAPVKGTHRRGTLDLEEFARKSGVRSDLAIDLAAAQISPTDYAKARDAIDQRLAIQLIGVAVSVLDYAGLTKRLLPGLRVDSVFVNPQMAVLPNGKDGWRFESRGSLSCSAIVKSPIDLELIRAGYHVVSERWTPGEAVVGTELAFAAALGVSRQGLQADLDSLRLLDDVPA